MQYNNIKDIKAVVKTDWSHGNHKFMPGTNAEVNMNIIPRDYVSKDGTIREGSSYESAPKQHRVGRVGKVVAVSCTKSGRTRGCYMQDGNPSRMFTRYYIQFCDNRIMGFHSHHLNKALSL